jgi:hypothetical protein
LSPASYGGVQHGYNCSNDNSPPHYKSRTINHAEAAFKPEPFNGTNIYNAHNWWQKLRGYLDLADVEDSVYCTLLRFLLVGDAETWFNSLPNQVQHIFCALEEAFHTQYFIPNTNKFAMLSDLRVRIQGQG